MSSVPCSRSTLTVCYRNILVHEAQSVCILFYFFFHKLPYVFYGTACSCHVIHMHAYKVTISITRTFAVNSVFLHCFIKWRLLCVCASGVIVSTDIVIADVYPIQRCSPFAYMCLKTTYLHKVLSLSYADNFDRIIMRTATSYKWDHIIFHIRPFKWSGSMFLFYFIINMIAFTPRMGAGFVVLTDIALLFLLIRNVSFSIINKCFVAGVFFVSEFVV